MYGVGETKKYDVFGKESVIIRNYLDGIKGGVILDVTDYTEDYIQCGQIIIGKDGKYKPMPISEGAYSTLPAGYEYIGVCMTTVPKDEPNVGVMTAGEANDNAVPYPVTAIKAALKTAVPTLRWDHD